MNVGIYGGAYWLIAAVEKDRLERERLLNQKQTPIKFECGKCRKQPEDCRCPGGPS